MAVYYGVIKDNRVILDHDTELADGTRVEVRPHLASPHHASEDELEDVVKERLRAAGILAPALPAGPDDDADDLEPIAVEGEPLSRLIIRERR